VLERLRAFPPNHQVALIAAVAAAMCVLLAAVWLIWLRVDYQPLFTNLRASDAAVIIAELDRKKIPYQLEDGGTSILVPADRVDATRLNVMTEDLPLKGTVGFELFNKSDMGLTDFAQKINYQRALQGELTRTIMTLDGVESARVHLSMGEDRIFRDDRVPPKASVTIWMKGGATLSARAAQGIQRLVAAAVPKLDFGNVVVLDEAGQVIAGPAQGQTPPAATSGGRVIVDYYTARIRDVLVRSYPQEYFAVTVSTTVDDGADLAAWTPNARNIPLQIGIAHTLPAAPETDATLRNLVATAIGTRVVAGDAIRFQSPEDAPVVAQVENAAVAQAGVAQVPFTRPASNVASSAPPALRSEEESDWLLRGALSFALLVVMVAGLVVLMRLARGPRRLNERKRAAFVARLQVALQQGGESVASQH
jgi:flagellar M-ring protein FliF